MTCDSYTYLSVIRPLPPAYPPPPPPPTFRGKPRSMRFLDKNKQTNKKQQQQQTQPNKHKTNKEKNKQTNKKTKKRSNRRWSEGSGYEYLYFPDGVNAMSYFPCTKSFDQPFLVGFQVSITFHKRQRQASGVFLWLLKYNNNIIIAFKGALRDFVQSPHCVANRLQHVRSSGSGATEYKSRAFIRCNMSCYVQRGTKGQLSC